MVLLLVLALVVAVWLAGCRGVVQEATAGRIKSGSSSEARKLRQGPSMLLIYSYIYIHIYIYIYIYIYGKTLKRYASNTFFL